MGTDSETQTLLVQALFQMQNPDLNLPVYVRMGRKITEDFIRSR